MINSCLCYDGIQGFWKEHDSWFEGRTSYAATFVKELGLSRVQELVKEQEEDFSKAVVRRGVHTDSEGVTYNSIIWEDDLVHCARG